MAVDISFDRDKTLLRTVVRAGSSDITVREGAQCTVHVSVHAPSEDGEKLIFDSSVAHRDGIAFVPGRTLHAEALERGVLGLQPGSAADVLCVDVDAGSDSELGIMQLPLSDALKERACTLWEEAQGSRPPPPLVAPSEPAAALPPPPASLSRWHIRVDTATDCLTPMELHGRSRLDWCEEAKEWATAFFKRGDVARANRRYKKAMLDLEIPTQWSAEDNVRRNQARRAASPQAARILAPTSPRPRPDLVSPRPDLGPTSPRPRPTSPDLARSRPTSARPRPISADLGPTSPDLGRPWPASQLRLALHLNVAACGLLAVDVCGEVRYDDTLAHATRALEADPSNVKALFRRGQAHLRRPRHINGLALALEDLRRAAELEPGNAAVRSMLARARAQQKALDHSEASMFGRMLQPAG